MNLKELYLRDFRNYPEIRVDFEPGVNLIVGNNAQGKTNMLEAVSYHEIKEWFFDTFPEIKQFHKMRAALLSKNAA